MKYHRHLFLSSIEALNSIFFENRHADKAIEYYLRNNRKWGSRDRRFFAESVYDCVRWWSLYWALLNREASNPDWGLLAASFWRRKIELPNFEELKAFDFRLFDERYQALKSPAVLQAFPPWLYERIGNEWGAWDSYSDYFNQPNALVLRVNLSRAEVKDVIKRLQQQDVQARTLVGTESGVLIEKRINIFQNTLFKEGLIEVQDGSSQSVVPFLDIQPGMRVVDACAGAGGKTLHIADQLNNAGKVVALDIHQWKLDQLKLRARRNRFSNIEIKIIESSKTIKRMKGSADRLLLDVPCTGLGVLRRNPDTKWKLSENRLAELVDIQKDILSRYSSILKSNGKMVYATCSILPSENEKQVKAFLEEHQDYRLLKQKKIFPTRNGFDGFYMALIERL